MGIRQFASTAVTSTRVGSRVGSTRAVQLRRHPVARHAAIRWSALLAASALLVSACGGPSSASQTSENGGDGGGGNVLRVAISTDPEPLDPATIKTLPGWDVMQPICQGLYRVSADGAPEPLLATGDPEWSPDSTTATITLRADVRFNDGTDLTAEAVKASLERSMETSPYLRGFAAVTAINAPSADTIEFIFDEPQAALAAELATPGGMIVSPKQVESAGDKFGNDPVCVGPFSFDGRVSGQSMRYVKSEEYYDRDAISVDAIEYQVMTDANARVTTLKSGAIDVAMYPPPASLKDLDADEGVELGFTSSLAWRGLVVNVANSDGIGKPPQQRDTVLAGSVEARQALSLALDRQSLADLNPMGLDKASCTPIGNDPRFADSPECPAGDVAAAKALLTDAGLELPVQVDLLATSDPKTTQLAQAIQGMANEAGFDLQITGCEVVTCNERITSGEYDVAIYNFGGNADPDVNISPVLSSTGTTFVTGLVNTELDELLASARTTIDEGERKDLYGQALDLARADSGVIFLLNQGNSIAFRAGVTNVSLGPTQISDLITAKLPAS